MRILAFGDSLTAGYHSMGAAYAPWACTLCQLLGAEVVDHIGLSGFTTAELVRSMDECSVTDVASRTWSGLRHKLRSAAVPYDIVLIMAGTNDLAGQARASAGALARPWPLVLALPQALSLRIPTRLSQGEHGRAGRQPAGAARGGTRGGRALSRDDDTSKQGGAGSGLAWHGAR